MGVAFWLLGIERDDAALADKTNEELRTLAAGKLQENGLEKVFLEIEMPLTPVLATMEMIGIGLDQEKVERLAREYRRQTAALKKQITDLVGEEINLNSPRQLSVLLFEKLKIGGRRRQTKTGLRSTGGGTLRDLAGVHPAVNPLIQYRENFKLLSTYLEPWQKLGDRVHPTFLQTGTATGRLSCQNPNLQNVPPALRSVFVPAPGYRLVACDYSQIELRVLASVSGDPAMLEAFENGVDIHRLTASKVFNVALEQVTDEMRQAGKTLNFGVVYGMGAAAFARASGRGRAEAEMFIAEYFADFSGVRQWQEEVKRRLRETGYAENANGRRRWLLDVFSSDQRLAAAAERAAINMPIQSLAADILKLAMVKIHRDLKPRMMLTVHDELLFEIENDRLEKTAAEIRRIMESVYSLRAPLKVSVKVGDDWGGLKGLS